MFTVVFLKWFREETNTWKNKEKNGFKVTQYQSTPKVHLKAKYLRFHSLYLLKCVLNLGKLR